MYLLSKFQTIIWDVTFTFYISHFPSQITILKFHIFPKSQFTFSNRIYLFKSQFSKFQIFLSQMKFFVRFWDIPLTFSNRIFLPKSQFSKFHIFLQSQFSFSNHYVKNFTSFSNHNLPFQITLSFSSRNLQKFHVFFLKSQTLKLIKIKSHFPFRITIF